MTRRYLAMEGRGLRTAARDYGNSVTRAPDSRRRSDLLDTLVDECAARGSAVGRFATWPMP